MTKSQKQDANSVATIGSFDGVHRGHRCLLEQVRGIADKQGLKAMAVTFALSPKSVLGGSDMARLNSMEERVALLTQAGMDEVALLDVPMDSTIMYAMAMNWASRWYVARPAWRMARR